MTNEHCPPKLLSFKNLPMPVEDKFLTFFHIFGGILSIKIFILIYDWRIVCLTILAFCIWWDSLRLFANLACLKIFFFSVFKAVLSLIRLTSSNDSIIMSTSWRFLPNWRRIIFHDCVLPCTFLLPFGKRRPFICLMVFRLFWTVLLVAHSVS